MTIPSVQDLYAQAVQAGTLQSDPAQQNAVTQLDKLYQTLIRPRKLGFLASLFKRPHPVSTAGIYLYGPVGRGKSMLMQFFLDAIVRWNVSHAPDKRYRVERHHFHEFMLGMHRQLHEQHGDVDQMQNRLTELADDLIARVDILCFDEFHVTDVADAMLLMPYFTRVLEGGVTLIATSNFAPADLYKNGLQRTRFVPFIELLQQRLTVVEVGGAQDYRLLKWHDKAAQQDHWLTPLNEQTGKDFSALFRDLAGYDIVHDHMQVEIPEQQRSVTVFRASPHVAWLQMDALLNADVGAADFIALAARFKIILLDGITSFAANENNHAKRFMLLIDTLYEANVQVYARATCEPEQLYPETGRLAFEFARTVSRLQEMRYRKI